MGKYLDNIGLEYFWEKIKSGFAESNHIHSDYVSKSGGYISGGGLGKYIHFYDYDDGQTITGFRCYVRDGNFYFNKNTGETHSLNLYLEGNKVWNEGNFNPSDYIGKTSANRPGSTRLYRYDNDSGYSVQTYWDGTYWVLRGHYADDNYHAPCRVGYADDAGKLGGREIQSGWSTANTVPVRDSNGDIFARLFRSTFGDQLDCSGAIAFRKNTGDNYIRFCSNPTAIKDWLGLSPYAKGYFDVSYGWLSGDIITCNTSIKANVISAWEVRVITNPNSNGSTLYRTTLVYHVHIVRKYYNSAVRYYCEAVEVSRVQGGSGSVISLDAIFTNGTSYTTDANETLYFWIRGHSVGSNPEPYFQCEMFRLI